MRMEAKVRILFILFFQKELSLDFPPGDVCPNAEVLQAGGVGEAAGEAGARQGGLPQARRPRQDHARATDIV